MPYRQLDDGRIVPVAPQPMRGLGDLVARATSALGVPTCASCEQRQALLNSMFSFRHGRGGR